MKRRGCKRMQASRGLEGYACSCIDRRPAQLCIRTPLHPSAAGTLLPPATRRTLALPFPSPPFLSSSPLSFFSSTPYLALTPFPRRESLASLAARTSRNHRIDDDGNGRRHGGCCAPVPVNVTLKTERACTYTVNLRCAMQRRATPARTVVSYVRERWTLIN